MRLLRGRTRIARSAMRQAARRRLAAFRSARPALCIGAMAACCRNAAFSSQIQLDLPDTFSTHACLFEAAMPSRKGSEQIRTRKGKMSSNLRTKRFIPLVAVPVAAALSTVVFGANAAVALPEGAAGVSATGSHQQGSTAGEGKFSGQGPVTPLIGDGARSRAAAASTVTRSEALQRAASWVGKGLAYNQAGYHDGYRMDCSGYVSMAWHLPNSQATNTFIPNGYGEWISKDDLKPGDALNNDSAGNSGHIALFEKWENSAHTSYKGYEFTGSGVRHRSIPYPYFSGYGTFKPMRYKNIVDDSTPVPTPEVPKAEPTQRVHADFNGDGRDDVAAVYGYDDHTVSVFTFLAKSDGGFEAPVKSWTSQPNYWTFKSVKMTAGDYNGDGRAELAAMYDYADGSVAMFTWPTNTDGTFKAPQKSWTTEPGNWYPEHVQLASGDYDGNGRDDIAAFYGYSDGRAALFTFKGQTDGGFAAPAKSWNVPEAYWWGDNVKFTSGDFNGDGRTDAAAIYGYDDGTVSAFTWIANTNGGFATPTKSWTRPPGNWTFESIKLTSGDYNGNGRDDLAAMYDYADGSAAMFTWLTDADGTFQSPQKSWTTEPGNWYPEHVQLASGDYDGNGRDDIAAFYGYSDARAALFTFKPNTSGEFAAPVKSWNVPADHWWGEHVKLG
ncbi:peptidase S8 and S53 [Streptomyces sp. SPB78]|nr:peptidase S8 and S53 [Streptomyces sp. SPB78]